jgi:hypothetical protein
MNDINTFELRFSPGAFEPAIQYADEHASEIEPELDRLSGEQMLLKHTDRGMDMLFRAMRAAADGDCDRARIAAREEMEL